MNKKLFIEKCKKMLNINHDLRKWFIRVVNIGNINDDPVLHGLFIVPTGNDFIGVCCSHIIKVPTDIKREDYLPEDFDGKLETFEVYDEIKIIDQDIGFNYHRELEKYSLFSRESIVDFDDLFKKMDLKIVEMI